LSFKKYWTFNVPIYFKTGTKQWSDQLIYALGEIPEDNIIYLLEDCYFTGGMPDWYSLYSDFKDMKMDCLRMAPGVPYPCDPYIFEYRHSCLKYAYMKVAKGSPYSVSMSAGIWRKEFLLSCLTPGETAWQVENEGSDRLNQRDGWSVWNVERLDMFVINTVFKGVPNKNYNDMMRRLKK